MRTWAGCRCVANNYFRVRDLVSPFSLEQAAPVTGLTEESLIAIYSNHWILDGKVKVTADKSFVQYTAIEGQSRLGQLRFTFSEMGKPNRVFVFVRRFADTGNIDPFRNPILKPTNLHDYVPLASVTGVASVLHNCTNHCRVVQTNAVLRNTMKHLNVYDATMRHDLRTREYVWNKLRAI